MLDMRYTRKDQSIPAPLSAGTVINEEGYALVADKAERVGYSVKLSTGHTDEDFVGVSAFEIRPPSRVPIVKDFDLPADADAAANHGMVLGTLIDPEFGAVGANSIRAVQDESGTPLVANSSPAANTSIVFLDTNGVLRLSVGNAWPVGYTNDADRLVGGSFTATGLDGITIRVRALYIPTLKRQIALVGSHVDATPLSSGASVSCIRRGLIYTSAYDTSLAWTLGDEVHTGSHGIFTKSGGDVIDGAIVVHIPTPEVPSLGIEFT